MQYGEVSGVGPGGSQEAAALVLEELSKGLNEVSAVVKGEAECRSESGPAAALVLAVQDQRMWAGWTYY